MYSRPGPFSALPTTPIAVKGLLIANAAVFLLHYFVVPLLLQPFGIPIQSSVGWFTRIFGLTPNLAILRGMVHQFVTYMFLHGGFSHILFNMLVLWMLGGELERVWRARPFLRYYLLCGVGAGLFQLFTPWKITAVGASGAVYGILVAFALVFPRRKLFLLFFPVPISARVLVPILVLLEVYLSTRGSDGVAHLAHVGGALVGFLYLKRVWRLREFLASFRWKAQRRRFRVLDDPPERDRDRWVH